LLGPASGDGSAGTLNPTLVGLLDERCRPCSPAAGKAELGRTGDVEWRRGDCWYGCEMERPRAERGTEYADAEGDSSRSNGSIGVAGEEAGADDEVLAVTLGSLTPILPEFRAMLARFRRASVLVAGPGM
jgi:hypothetical protein